MSDGDFTVIPSSGDCSEGELTGKVSETFRFTGVKYRKSYGCRPSQERLGGGVESRVENSTYENFFG